MRHQWSLSLTIFWIFGVLEVSVLIGASCGDAVTTDLDWVAVGCFDAIFNFNFVAGCGVSTTAISTIGGSADFNFSWRDFWNLSAMALASRIRL